MGGLRGGNRPFAGGGSLIIFFFSFFLEESELKLKLQNKHIFLIIKGVSSDPPFRREGRASKPKNIFSSNYLFV